MNDTAQKLAQELADLIGENLATAVTEALRERQQRVKSRQAGSLAHRLNKIGEECAASLNEPQRSIAHGEMLYDERSCRNLPPSKGQTLAEREDFRPA